MHASGLAVYHKNAKTIDCIMSMTRNSQSPTATSRHNRNMTSDVQPKQPTRKHDN